MRVSAKAEYACVAMLELAAKFGDPQPVRVKAIADAHGVPLRFLVQILLQLKGSGLVASTRGAAGGYVLAKAPDQVSILDIVGVIDRDGRHERGADLFFQVVAARYETGSIVLSTNRPFREWGVLFDVDNTLATALIDRLMHHGEGIVIQGDSYRMRDKASDSTDE